jgi:alpha-L-fucosidase
MRYLQTLLAALFLLDVVADGTCNTAWPRDQDTNFINKDIAEAQAVTSADECCALCAKMKGCTVWSLVKNGNLCRFRNSTSSRSKQKGAVSGYTVKPPAPTPAPPRTDLPLPNPRQLDFMDLELTQFMHFGIPTFWDPPKDYLYGSNPTYHDCHTTTIDHGPQTKDYYPCLNPNVFNPTDLSAEDWMEASSAMGMREIIITAHHEGGFALWPSNFTNYSVAASSWKNGKGDVLREFADAANKWGIKISYYLNVQNDGYMVDVAKYDGPEFIRRQVGMIKEVLSEYGPVNRFWFDGTKTVPKGTDEASLWKQVYEAIRTVSPDTMISSYRGDICASTGSLYMNSGPAPNSTDPSTCKGPFSEEGKYFHPTEMHGITIQEGPDGNSDQMPTYWFWHPWACAHNISGCPWVGHGNASRIFDSYLTTVGHGAVLNMNIPPERTGRMNVSVAQVMRDVGKAINDTFKQSVAKSGPESAPCGPGIATLTVPVDSELSSEPGSLFDYVVTMEDMSKGQRIANYSIEFQRQGSSTWEMLVPPVHKNKSLSDRPDGHDPRDQYVGHKV